MSDRQKTVVAAILAVHSGRMSPDEAAAMLESPEIPATLVEPGVATPTVRLAEGDFPIEDVLADPEKQRQALLQIGIGEQAQHTLFSFGVGNADGHDMRVIRDTLQSVATTGRELAGRKEFESAADTPTLEQQTRAPSETGRRTLKLTTGKFFPSFGQYGEQRYEIRKEHARGGMGRVMVAKDMSVGREVALKELLPGMASGASIPASVPAGVSESGGIVERFLREARITGQLEHPNIVPVYEIGRYDDGSFYYTMRFIRGKTLAERLREIRKDESLDRRAKLAARIRLLDQFIDVCNAIAYAHSKGVVHRDIKPDNIMLGDYGETLVLDWGLARLKGQEDKALRDLQRGTVALSQSLIESDSDALTLDGSIVGTPAYMAPEQARGELDKVDEQSDVYALGAVLYQILTGLPPYEGPMASLIVQAVLAGPPRAVRSREPHVAPELEALVEAAMAREKDERLKTAMELASEVKAFRDGRTLGSYAYSKREMVARFVHQNRTPVGIATLGFLLVIMATVFFMQRLAVERDEAMTAHADAEQQRANAMHSLQLANEERAERERLELEALERERSEYALRLREAEQLLGTIEGMRIEPALRDLDSRLARYEAELSGPPAREILELSADEQIGNGVLLSNVLGYVSARQNLLLLLEGPVGAELPEAFLRFDMEAERRKLDDLRARTARLARFNGDFTLAEFLLSGSALDAELIRRERSAIQSAHRALLDLHAQRIHEALDDLRAGIGRAGRDSDAPGVEAYARTLSQYRHEQTVDILAAELERLKTKPQHAWERSDIHIAVLVSRVFGRIEQPSRVVPLLSAFLDRVDVTDAVQAATAALGETMSAEGTDALIAQYRRRGIDYLDTAMPLIARAPMPPRLRNPQGHQDFLDLAIVRRSRGDAVGAIEAATRALNLGEESDEALMLRALARADANLRDEALADMNRLLERDSGNYEALLARAAVRDVLTDGDAALQDLDAAIDLEPENPRAYLRRADVLFTRARVAESVADLRRAVELRPASIEYRLALGERTRSLGRPAYPDAEAEFTRVIEQAPDDWRGWSARCVLRRDTGFSGCISDGLEATRLNPHDGRAWSFMAQAYYGLGRITEGIEAATNAVEAEPDRWLAFYYRGILYLRLQDAEDSRARSTPNDITTIDARRVTLERAVSDFRSAVHVNPEDFRSWALMADTLVELDRHEEAKPAAVAALKLAPFNGDQSTTGMGNYVARLALLEIEGAAWTRREPEGIPAMVRLAHYHMGRAARPRASLDEVRAAVRLLGRARDAINDATPLTQRYERNVAEDRLLLHLLGSEDFSEAVGIAELRSKGEFVTAADHLRRARALAGLARQHIEGNVKFLAADAQAMEAAQAELRSLSASQRRQHAAELTNRAFDALTAAVAAGLKDEAAATSDANLRALQGDERWEAWLEALRASTAQPPADPGLPTRVAAINFVQEGGPAWNGGMRAGDVLAEVAGEVVSTREEFTARLRSLAPDETYTVKVRRYPLREGRLTVRANQEGAPVLDENGIPAWRFTEHELTLQAGFLGIRIENGEIPSPLDP